MGTDAEIYSKKKRVALYIDRKYNLDITGLSDYDEFEEGVSPKEALSLIACLISNINEPERCGHKPSFSHISNMIWFINTLDADDTVILRDEHENDYREFERVEPNIKPVSIAVRTLPDGYYEAFNIFV